MCTSFALQFDVVGCSQRKWLSPLTVIATVVALSIALSRSMNHLSPSSIDWSNSPACTSTCITTPSLPSCPLLLCHRHHDTASLLPLPRQSFAVVITAADLPLAPSYRPSTSLLDFVEILVAGSPLGSYYGIPDGSAARSLPRNGGDAAVQCQRRHACLRNTLEKGLASNDHSPSILSLANSPVCRQSQFQRCLCRADSRPQDATRNFSSLVA